MYSFKKISTNNKMSYFFARLPFYRESLKQQKLTFLELVQKYSLRDTCFDELLGIETPIFFFKDNVKTEFNDGVDTIPTPYRIIRQLMHYLGPYQELSFMDIGCGQGRMLCALMTMRFQNLIGVEPNKKAFKMSVNNLAINVTQNHFTKVTLLEGDILHQSLTKANIFYLYLPFYHDTSKKFMEKLFEDYLRSPRPIILIIGGVITIDVKGYGEIFDKKATIENFDIYHTKEVR